MKRLQCSINSLRINIGKVSKIKKIWYLLFGEWNGVQNFVAPAVLIFMFEPQSFFQWLVNVLTYQSYYLPIALYIVSLIYIGFIMLKAYAQWHNTICKKSEKPEGKLGRDLLIPLIIRFHQWLFALLTLMMVVYVLRNGYSYFYQKHVSVYKIYFSIVTFAAIYVSIYIYMLLDVAVPLIKRGHSLQKAERCLHLFIIKRPEQALLKYAVQFILIFASIFIFRYVIQQIDNFNSLGLLFMSENPVRIMFKDAQTIGQLIFNILLLPIGFLLSNLLYSPLMYILKMGFERVKFTARKV